MDWPCLHGDQPESALLRVIVIGEILQPDEAMLSAIAHLMPRLGLLDLVEGRRPLKVLRGGSAPADSAS